MSNDVYIEKTEEFPSYPDNKDNFNPGCFYPEYPWGDSCISKKKNTIYEMIRNILYNLELDKDNFNKPSWNPLGKIIKPGDTVLIKPNMVLDKHEGDVSLGVESVITHPSLVRAIADYVLIALKRQGKLIIGDAPLQSCDFKALTQNAGYTDLVHFYKEKKIDIELVDFRLIKSSKISGVCQDIQTLSGDFSGYSAIDLEHDSMHNEIKEKYKRFRVTNYDPSKMQKHHNDKKHEYLVSNSILNADVVINLPKPKTHRKAGVTAALKNLIGINGHKDWLPHHTKGCIKDGGDEYLSKSLLKSVKTSLVEKRDIAAVNNKLRKAKIIRYLTRPVSLMIKLIGKDQYYEGSWYGNDTIWRTILDLNRIMMYCDKKGVMQNSIQRKQLIIADMIISGEKEGPLEPTPKPVGIIVGSFNPVATDAVIAALMGFDVKKIPSIINGFSIEKYSLINSRFNNIIIKSNNLEWNRKKISEFNRSNSLKYIPSKGWQGNIELE